jgi:hypothetical protein
MEAEARLERLLRGVGRRSYGAEGKSELKAIYPIFTPGLVTCSWKISQNLLT